MHCDKQHQCLLQLPDDHRHGCWITRSSCGTIKSVHAALTTTAMTTPALTTPASAFMLYVPFVQDMYDKQRGKKRGLGSNADSDGGQTGFGSGRPAKKQLMSDEQVGWPLYYHNSVAHLQVVIRLLLGWMTPALLQSNTYRLVLGAYMACETSMQDNAGSVHTVQMELHTVPKQKSRCW